MGHLLLVCTAILAVLPGEDSYRGGNQAEREARYGDAVSAFERCAELDGPLSEYAEIRAAVCRFKGGDAAGAIQRLERAVKREPGGPWTPFAEYELGRMYFAQSEHVLAEAHFESLFQNELNLWWLGDAKWMASENRLAVPAVRAEGFAFFRNVAGHTVWKQKRYDASSLLLRSSDPSDRLHAVLGLVKSGATDEAAPILADLKSETSKVQELEALWRYATARLKLAQGKRLEGHAILNALVDERVDRSLARESLKTLLDDHTRKYEFEAAERALVRLAAGDRGSTESSDGHSRLARAYARKSRWPEAFEHYRFVAGHASDAAAVQAALLSLGHAHRKLGHTAEALDAFKKLTAGHPNSGAAIEAGFWRGEILENAKASKRALKAYRLAATNGVTQYYGYRAQQMLAVFEDLSAQSAPRIPQAGGDLLVRPLSLAERENPQAADGRAEDPRFARLRFFGHEGYPEAEWEAVYLARGLDRSAGSGELYRALGEAGTAYTAMQFANAIGFGQNADGTQTLERLRIRYPLAYWDVVKPVAEANEIDPYLILSVARQESTYRPALSSSAGAVGIMQLMPSTAKYLADQYPDIDASERFQLMQPRTSIKFGARYLKRMLDRSDGNLVYALASYNAGPGNCDKWRRRFRGYDMAEFVESIPFSETRNYVKRVLANYATYYSLYSVGP